MIRKEDTQKYRDYYYQIKEFHNKAVKIELTEEDRNKFISQTKTLIEEVQIEIDDLEGKKIVDTFQTFNLGFIEILREILLVIERIDLNVAKFNVRKLESLKREITLILGIKERLSFLEYFKELGTHRFLLLLRNTLLTVSVTVFFGLIANFLLGFLNYTETMAPILNNLLLIEAGMGALIVFITSFNLSYTNDKRGETDLAVIQFTSDLNIYARRIRHIFLKTISDDKERMKAFEEVHYYFDCIGANILEGINPKDTYHLKFDMATLQSLDRINAIVERYFDKLDLDTVILTRGTQDNLIESLNKFQIISTIRNPDIFIHLNHWLIRITYIILVAIAPLSAIPRILVVNIFQRAFFNVAKETDNAIFCNSLSSIPVESRILRRFCRIGALLNG